jgi:hypothetical protein
VSAVASCTTSTGHGSTAAADGAANNDTDPNSKLNTATTTAGR